ncbi:MAG: hypothetical protein S0880_06510 [Actinomycetota bacterium]|nr:hypothetical protein [Actinomycetota bacterium]
MIEHPPLPTTEAARALGSCAWRANLLLARGRLRQPTGYVGRRLTFADGTSSAVYRETAVDRPAPPAAPAVLVVAFRLRHVRSDRAHAAFRAESLLNTVLFAGFPGFVSKLWLAHDQDDRYRGFYEWDDPALAHDYVGALWRVLALVSVPSSIRYAVLPGFRRDQLLDDPAAADAIAPGEEAAWWRLTDVTSVTA